MPDSVLALQMILSSMRDKETLAQRDVQLAQSRLLELTGTRLRRFAVRCRAISVFLPMKNVAGGNRQAPGSGGRTT